MSRLAKTRARVMIGFFATSILVAGIPALAYAQTHTEPVIDSWPRKVRYKGDATIEAHMNDGTEGQEVSLERRNADSKWHTINSKATNDRSRVKFHVNDLHVGANYRLVYVDPAGARQRSQEVRIGVVPKMTFDSSEDDVMVHRRVRLFGTLSPGDSSNDGQREVVLEQRIAGEWRSIGRAPVEDGRFERKFRPDHHGFRLVRARFAGDASNAEAFVGAGLRIYDPDPATWYGPGLYGNRTACGKRLEQDTLGVAHRSLPCGTDVAILYQGRTITVQVIDRGPYGDADWDLTEKTADRLGFEGRDTIGVDPKS
jgi:hypothetical protein